MQKLGGYIRANPSGNKKTGGEAQADYGHHADPTQEYCHEWKVALVHTVIVLARILFSISRTDHAANSCSSASSYSYASRISNTDLATSSGGCETVSTR